MTTYTPSDKTNELANQLSALIKEIRGKLESGQANSTEIHDLHNAMMEKAYKLHQHLKSENIPIKHSKNMIKNRGMSPDDIEFYNHIHPSEDLVEIALYGPPKKIKRNTYTTINLEIYTVRWGHCDTYRITINKNGWIVENIAIGGQCNQKGHPYLFRNLEQDNVQYPHQLEDWMNYCWDECMEKNWTQAQLEEALTSIFEWVNTVEKNAPRNGLLNGLC